MISTMLTRDGHLQLDRLRAQQLLDQLEKLQTLRRSAEAMINETAAELCEVHRRLAGS